MVVEEGATFFTLPDPRPPLQLYVSPPPAVRVAEAPAQSDAGLADTDAEGEGFTVMLTDAVFEQELLLVPVTVYVVEDVGATVTELPLPASLLHE